MIVVLEALQAIEQCRLVHYDSLRGVESVKACSEAVALEGIGGVRAARQKISRLQIVPGVRRTPLPCPFPQRLLTNIDTSKYKFERWTHNPHIPVLIRIMIIINNYHEVAAAVVWYGEALIVEEPFLH